MNLESNVLRKRLITFLVTVTLGFVLFANCGRSTTPPAKAPDAQVECSDSSCPLPPSMQKDLVVPTKVVAQENWQITINGDGWNQVDPPNPETKMMFASPEQKLLLILVKEEVGDATFADYVIGTVRAFVADGNNVSSIKQQMIGENKFVKVQVNTDDATIWVWLAVKSGFGYGFSCGGPMDADAGAARAAFCQDTADTLEIN